MKQKEQNISIFLLCLSWSFLVFDMIISNYLQERRMITYNQAYLWCELLLKVLMYLLLGITLYVNYHRNAAVLTKRYDLVMFGILVFSIVIQVVSLFWSLWMQYLTSDIMAYTAICVVMERMSLVDRRKIRKGQE